MNKEERFDEAIERMKLLKLDKQCIEAFTKGKVWESEGFGALYEVNDKEQMIIDKFEAHHKDCDWCSEFGSIAIKSQFGGLVRVG